MIGLLVACSQGELGDLDGFMRTAQAKAKPTAPPELPVFQDYPTAIYEAGRLRSPFARTTTQASLLHDPDPDPDLNTKLSTMSEVGALSYGNTRWALMQDERGMIHRIAQPDKLTH